MSLFTCGQEISNIDFLESVGPQSVLENHLQRSSRILLGSFGLLNNREWEWRRVQWWNQRVVPLDRCTLEGVSI